MIRHIVLWKLGADDADTRALHAEKVSADLMALRGVVPEILDITVAPNAAYAGQNWDIGLIADFADIEALERYVVHPRHQEVVAYVRSAVSDRASVDFKL